MWFLSWDDGPFSVAANDNTTDGNPKKRTADKPHYVK
jgi:hypothetical protein